MLLCESCNCRKCKFFFKPFKKCLYFSESALLEWNWSIELFFFFLGKRFFHNFQFLELVILKNGLCVQFYILHFFYFDVIVLTVIFLTHGSAVGPFHLETCCKWSGFRLKNDTFYAQGTYPYTELCWLWGWDPWCHPENPFHFTPHWGKGAADADT